LLEQQRLATLKARESAERGLAEAEQELKRLPRLGRGRRRDELQATISREATAVRMADTRLARLEQEAVAAKRVCATQPAVRRPSVGVTQHNLPNRAPTHDLGLGL
jgi:hypothetical protein